MLSALTSPVLVSETWFIFTCEIDVYILEYTVFKMRYAPTFIHCKQDGFIFHDIIFMAHSN